VMVLLPATAFAPAGIAAALSTVGQATPNTNAR